MIGSATVTRLAGIFFQLKIGDPVFQGDLIETTAGGRVSIRFIDGTVFSLSNSARMALKEFPEDGTSRPALVDVARGDFAFIAGEMAKAGRMEIDTPVASIRGRSPIGGFGTLSLISLFFAAMEKVQAAPPPNAAQTDDEQLPFDYTSEPHGSFEVVTKEAVPRHFLVADPGVTWAFRLNSSSELTVSQSANTPTRMEQLHTIQQNVLHTYSVGLQAMQGPTFNGQSGSTTNPNFEILPGGARPINFTAQPDTGSSSGSSNPAAQELTHTTSTSKTVAPPAPPPPDIPPPLPPDTFVPQPLILHVNGNPVIQPLQVPDPGPINAPTGIPGSTLTLANNFSFSDADVTDTHTVTSHFNAAASGVGAPLGTFVATEQSDTVDGSGGLAHWQYQVAADVVNAMPAGSVRHEVFDVNVADDQGGMATHEVIIAIDGPVPVNQAPVNTVPVSTLTVNEDTALTFTGGNTISVHDVDGNLTSTQLTVLNGTLTVSLAGGASISGGANGSSTLTLTGSETQINSALATLSYQGGPNFNGNDTLTVLSTDGAALTSNDTATINITAVNDAPLATITPLSYSATEQTSLSLKSNGLSISDVDAGAGSVTVTLSVVEGTLTVTAGGSGAGVSGSGSSSVTITGTVAQINALLNTDGTSTVSYIDNSNTPAASTTLTLAVNDNGNTGGGALASNDTATINITAVNDAPVIDSVSGSVSTNQNTPVTLKAPTGTVTDADAAASDVLLATLKVTHGTLTPAGSVPGVTIVPGQDGSNGTLSFTGTQAAITQAIETGVIYTPTLNYTGPDQLKVTVDDQGHTGIGGAQTATATVDITVSNDQAPAVTAGNTIGYIEQAAAIAVDNALGVTDADNATLAGATVAISSGFQSGDTLTINGTTSGDIVSGGNTIHYNYNSGTHTMSLSGADTVGDYQAALRLVAFSNATNDDPTAGGTVNSRTLSWAVNDGTLDSSIATTTVNLSAVNDAPLATITPLSYSATEQTSLSLKSNGLSISDVDAGAGSVTVTLSVVEGTLTVTAGGSGAGVSGSGSSSVTITGTVAQINALLNTDGTSTVSYIDNSNTPAASTTLTLAVNDNGNTGGGALTSNDTATINITAVNDAPLATITPLSYSATEQTSLSLKSNGLSISDVDAGAGSVTVTLSVVEGTLTVTAGGSGAGVSGSGSSSVTITGTVAQINALLNTDGTSTVSYIDNSNTPAASTTLTLAVNDNGNTGGGALASNDTATINITAVNDAPVIDSVSGSVSTNQNTPVTLKAPTGTVTDADAAASDVLLATLKVTHGTLTPAGSVPGVTIVPGQDGSNGTLSFTGTQAAITQAIETGVIYTPTLNYTGPDQLKVTVDDQGHTGIGGAQTATATVDITVSNDQAPAVTAGNTIGYIEQAAAIAVDNALGVTDADNATLAGATVAISSGFQSGDTLTINGTTSGDIVSGGNTIHYNYNSGTHTMSLSGADTVGDYQAALRLVAFSNATNDDPTAGGTVNSRTLSWAVNDGTLDSSIATTTVNLSAVNDAPLATITPLSYSATEQTSLSLKSNGLSISDVDAGAGSVTVTLSVVEGTLTVTAGGSGAGVSGSGSSSVTITGTVAQINALLNTDGTSTVSYIDNSDTPAASTTLTLAVNDNGNTGGGGADQQ